MIPQFIIDNPCIWAAFDADGIVHMIWRDKALPADDDAMGYVYSNDLSIVELSIEQAKGNPFHLNLKHLIQ